MSITRPLPDCRDLVGSPRQQQQHRIERLAAGRFPEIVFAHLDAAFVVARRAAEHERLRQEAAHLVVERIDSGSVVEDPLADVLPVDQERKPSCESQLLGFGQFICE